LSQEAFADLSGFARSYMSRVERGKSNLSLDALEALADTLKVDVKVFFEVIGTELVNGKKPKPVQVPFNKDGTCFNPTLRRSESNKFTVGTKSNPVSFVDFKEALDYLKSMDKAYWRRPNRAGNWGLVVAERWGDLPEKYSTYLAHQ
jgi:hypothetical protein